MPYNEHAQNTQLPVMWSKNTRIMSHKVKSIKKRQIGLSLYMDGFSERVTKMAAKIGSSREKALLTLHVVTEMHFLLQKNLKNIMHGRVKMYVMR